MPQREARPPRRPASSRHGHLSSDPPAAPGPGLPAGSAACCVPDGAQGGPNLQQPLLLLKI